MIVFFSVAIILISILSVNLYRAIIKPLRKIEEAAEVFGQGKLDYVIKIKEKRPI